MKEVTKEALHGFSGISTTELQTIDGGGKFAFIKNWRFLFNRFMGSVCYRFY